MTYISRNNPTGLIGVGGESPATHHKSIEGYEGIVVDVIVDQFHPQYGKDGYVAGCIKVRIFEVDTGKDSELLDWAFPIDSTIQEYPLLGEQVKITKVLGQYHYFRKTNLTNKLQENAMLNLESQLDNRPSKLRQKVTSKNKEIEKEKHKFGEYFKPDSRVRQLKHFEGDLIVQGKMGNSIRFGSSQADITSKSLSPNVIIRAGQAKEEEVNQSTSDTVHGLILENINLDVSSLWLTTDQVLNFRPITRELGSFFRSIRDGTTTYDGASGILSSDRIILTSKNDHIMLFSNDEVYINSFSRIGIDTNESIVLTANLDFSVKTSRNFEVSVDEDALVFAASDIAMVSGERASLLSNKVYIGSIDSDEEPMIGGTSLSKWLARLILVLMGEPMEITAKPWISTQKAVLLPPQAITGTATFQHTIPMIGTLNPQIATALIMLYSELVQPNVGQRIQTPFSGAPFNSIDNFTSINNQDPSMAIVKNEFKEGTKRTVEKNKWKLSDSYYKVT